jgi:hypothetical protein
VIDFTTFKRSKRWMMHGEGKAPGTAVIATHWRMTCLATTIAEESITTKMGVDQKMTRDQAQSRETFLAKLGI